LQAPSPPGYEDCDAGGVDLTELSPLEADALLDPRRERDVARWAERLGVSNDELRRAAERARAAHRRHPRAPHRRIHFRRPELVSWRVGNATSDVAARCPGVARRAIVDAQAGRHHRNIQLGGFFR
jgi:hypothetical protein